MKTNQQPKHSSEKIPTGGVVVTILGKKYVAESTSITTGHFISQTKRKPDAIELTIIVVQKDLQRALQKMEIGMPIPESIRKLMPYQGKGGIFELSLIGYPIPASDYYKIPLTFRRKLS